eukprot:PhM_4_TR7210/c0_g1_i1/m.89946
MGFFQNLMLVATTAWDCYFVYSLHSWHNSGHPHHLHFIRPMAGIEEYRLRIDGENNYTMLAFHIATGMIPLFGSLYQISSVLRAKSIEVHRWVGRLVLASAFASAIPTISLAYKIMDLQDRPLEMTIVAAFGILWIISIFATYYYAAVKKNIPKHRAWGVRFSAYTHFVPLVSRMVGLTLLKVLYKSSDSMYSEDPPTSVQPALWTKVVWGTFLVLPLTEFLVLWESRVVKKAAPAKKE